MVRSKQKVQTSPGHLWPEPLTHRLTARCKGSPAHPDLQGPGATSRLQRAHRPPSAQHSHPPHTVLRVPASPPRGTAAFPPLSDSTRGGGAGGHPSPPGCPQEAGPERSSATRASPAAWDPGISSAGGLSPTPSAVPGLEAAATAGPPARARARAAPARGVRGAGGAARAQVAADGRPRRLEGRRAPVNGAACQALASPRRRPTLSSTFPSPPPHQVVLWAAKRKE